jgi:hypothetical protein
MLWLLQVDGASSHDWCDTAETQSTRSKTMKFLKVTLLAAMTAVLSMFAMPEGMTSSADAGHWRRQRIQNYNFAQRQVRQEVRGWNNVRYRSGYGPVHTRVIVR